MNGNIYRTLGQSFLACALILLVTTCGHKTASTRTAGLGLSRLAPARTAQQRETILSDLKGRLAKQLAALLAKRASVGPSGASNKPWIAVKAVNQTTFELTWREANVGDYDLDGEVGIGDLTPLADNYQAVCTWNPVTHLPDGDPTTPTGLANWQVAAADGDRSGDVGIGDIAPIAQNFGVKLVGYDVYQDGQFVPNPNDPAHPTDFSQATMPSIARPDAGNPDLANRIWPLYTATITTAGAAQAVSVAVRPVGPGMVEEPTAETDVSLVYPGGIPPPTGVAAWPSDSAIVLSWNVQPNAVGYNVYISQVSGDPSAAKVNDAPLPQQTVPGAQVHFRIDNLVNGYIYYFRVTSVDSQANEGPKSSEVQGVPNADPLYPAARTLTLNFQGLGLTQLAWERNYEPGVAYYEVYESSTPNDPNPTLITPGGFWPPLGQTTVTYTNTDLPNAEYRYWRVRTVKWSGNTSPTSNEVKVWQGGMSYTSGSQSPASQPPDPPFSAVAISLDMSVDILGTAFCGYYQSIQGDFVVASSFRRPFGGTGSAYTRYLYEQPLVYTPLVAVAVDYDADPIYGPPYPRVWTVWSSPDLSSHVYVKDHAFQNGLPLPSPIHPTDTADRLSMAIDSAGTRYVCYGSDGNVRVASMPAGPTTTWSFETIAAGAQPIVLADTYPKVVYRASDMTLHLAENQGGTWSDFKLGDAPSMGRHGADLVNGELNVAFVNATTHCLCAYLETSDHAWQYHETTYEMAASPDDPVVVVAKHDLGGHLLVLGNSISQGKLFFYSVVGDKFFWPEMDYGMEPLDITSGGVQDFALDPVTGDLFVSYNDLAGAPTRTWGWTLTPMGGFP